MKIVSLGARAVFFLLIPFFVVTLVSSEAVYSQTSDPIDPTHNFPSQSQSDRQRPSDDLANQPQEQQDREETLRKQPDESKVPPVHQEGDRAQQEEQERWERERLGKKERVEEEKRRQQEKEDRLKEERESKAAQIRDRIQKIRERTQQRIEQQREKQHFKPDLIADNLEVLPPGIIQHQTVTLVAYVRNAGARQTRDIPVHFYLGETPITEKVINMEAGEAREVVITIPLATPGSQTVTVKIDPNNKIAEKSKRNNKQTRTFKVTPAPHDDEQSKPGPHLSGEKQQKAQMALPVSRQKQKTDPTPKALGTIQEQPVKPEPPDLRLFLNQPGFANLQIFVPTNYGLVTGGGTHLDVKVSNGGDTDVTLPFTIAICKAKYATSGDSSKYIGTATIPALAKNNTISTTISWSKGKPEEEVNYTAIVDTGNVINEGTKGGENDNISNIFKYTTLTVIPPNPGTFVSVNNLQMTPPWITEKDWIKIDAEVTGEDYWELSYVYYNAKGNKLGNSTVLSSWSSFPDNGIKIPSPFLKENKSSSASHQEQAQKISVSLKAKNSKSGQSDEEALMINRAHPLNGTLTLSHCFYEWDKSTEKIKRITAKLTAKTNSSFKIDGYSSRALLGSLAIQSMVINKKYGEFSGQFKKLSQVKLKNLNNALKDKKSTTLKKAETKSIACENYLTYKGVINSLQQSTFEPKNGVVEIPISVDAKCVSKVIGYQYPYGEGTVTGRPEASLFINYTTTSGSDVLHCTMPVWDATLIKTIE